MNYSALKNIIKDKNFTMEQVAVGIDMSVKGLYAAMKNDSLRIRDLESIAKFLEVPLSELLSGSSSGSGSGTNIQVNNKNGVNYNHMNVSVGECLERVANLERQIENMKEHLALKDKIIKLLESK